MHTRSSIAVRYFKLGLFNVEWHIYFLTDRHEEEVSPFEGILIKVTVHEHISPLSTTSRTQLFANDLAFLQTECSPSDGGLAQMAC
jgi:hypothetical protein